MTSRALHAGQEVPIRRGAAIAGRALGTLATLFLLLDAGAKLAVPEIMIANSPPLGLPADPALYRALGALLAACTLLYAVPRTAPLGAVLLTGYLGGTIAIHVRAGSPLLTHTLFGADLGAMLWTGLWLRDRRLRILLARPTLS